MCEQLLLNSTQYLHFIQSNLHCNMTHDLGFAIAMLLPQSHGKATNNYN